jgi:hypothetical protein
LCVFTECIFNGRRAGFQFDLMRPACTMPAARISTDAPRHAGGFFRRYRN